MELVEAIRGRRSIRRFKADPVPEEPVREVLDAEGLSFKRKTVDEVAEFLS